jgi:cellulose synthase/poly-beta-1,6-N-acetylglucosamine synthase-like glycosyltransferase
MALALAGVNVVAQVIFAVLGAVKPPIVYAPAPARKLGIVTCARDEENVISALIQSVQQQNYDSEKMHIFVVADNCTDRTAEIARANGAEVIERENLQEIGKGYALDYFFRQLLESGRVSDFDGFLIFDSDNTLDPNFLQEMNNAFAAGYDVVTGYRNSSNFGASWVSGCSALWFIREARLYNKARQAIGFNSHVGGTGFLFDSQIIEQMGGWNYHLITEDLEFSMDTTSNGYKIGYCEAAVFYDEQPTKFGTSWKQRVRWAKGFLQVFWHYMPRLVRASMETHSASFLDLTFLVMPWMVITFLRIVLGFLYAALGFVSWSSQIDSTVLLVQGTVLGSLALILFALLTVFLERKRIAVSTKKLIFFCALFPVYILSYVPISFVAIFKKASWKRIAHHGVGGSENSPKKKPARS